MVIIHCKMYTLDVQEAVDSPYRAKRNQHLRLEEGFLCVFTIDSMMLSEDANIVIGDIQRICCHEINSHKII